MNPLFVYSCLRANCSLERGGNQGKVVGNFSVFESGGLSFFRSTFQQFEHGVGVENV